MSKDKSPLIELPVTTPSHSYADWSNDVLLTTNFGYLVPTFCRQVLPGTGIKWRSSHFGRLAPMLSPVYGKVNIFTYRFVVRNRDIATYWDSFITNGDQRMTWQQNESSFVPPVKSMFKPLDLLLNPYFVPIFTKLDDNAGYFYKPINERFASYSAYQSYMATTYVTPAIRSDVFSHNSGFTFNFLQTSSYKYDAMYVCEINSEPGGINTKIYPIQGNTFTFTPTSVYIFFRPNFSELTDIQGTQNTIADYYSCNPFSPGTLMDYLGVDLKGFYIQNARYWYDVWNVLAETYLGATPTPKMESDGNTAAIGRFIREFALNHMVFSIFGYFADSGVTPSDSVALYGIDILGYGSAGLTVAGSPSSTAYKNLIDEYFMPATASEKNPYVASSDRLEIEMLPIHAYNFIYNEWFRDQNLIPINVNCRFDVQGNFLSTFLPGNSMLFQDIIEVMKYFHLKRKAWEKDLFTTGLPGPQRGPAIRYMSNVNVTFDNTTYAGFYMKNRNGNASASGNVIGATYYNDTILSDSSYAPIVLDPIDKNSIFVDLSQATIENFRWANKMQEFLEIKARTGNRYFEMMQGLWGVDIEDAKLNRPIYMDGSKTPIQISEVLQTSSTDVSTGQPLGDMAGRATAVGGSDTLDWLQKDWAFMIEILTVVPRVSYMRGLDKSWTRKQYLDYPWFKFAQLGEETVDKRELVFDGTTEERPFAYQSRYYDMKLVNDTVHGEFKDSLDYWHFARDFDSMPQLGQAFIEVDPPYRQFAVTDKHYHHVWLSVSHDISVHQPLPHLPVPSL